MRKCITNYSYAELSLVFKEYFDISKITETAFSKELSPKSQISGDAQTSGAVRSDAARGDSRTLGWIGGAAIACAAGVVCAGIAYRNRRKHNG